MPAARTFDVFGSTLTALQWGDPNGVPTFALHGWLDNAATFNRLAPLLGELNLIALDFAGHGHSDHRPAGVHYHPLMDIQDVLAIAEQLGWARFNLIGHSMGAGIATELAGLFPERVLRSVAVDGFLATGGAGAAERMDDNREALQQMLGSAGRRAPVYASVEDMIRRVTQATDQSWEAAAELVARGHRATAEGFTWRTDPRIRFRTPLRMAAEHIGELMRRSTSPALLIVADSGDRWYLDGLEDRQAAHPNLKLARVAGPHHIHLEPDHYREVAALTRSFLGLHLPEAALE
ncbi:MAG: alpha/beta hydrolase [Pseudomonadales bacterium]